MTSVASIAGAAAVLGGPVGLGVLATMMGMALFPLERG